MAPAEQAVLDVRGACLAFSGVVALEDVTLQVSPAEIVGLIGPNGAGKTTLVNVISGYQRLDAGSVHLFGRDIAGVAPHALARRGLARTFQAVRPFTGLSVAENVELGALGRGGSRRKAQAVAAAALDRVGLAGAAQRPASALPYGDERRLAVARALAVEPKLLLLDEPAAGLNEAETAELLVLIRELVAEQRFAVLVIEHDMALIRGLCHRVHVLARGSTIFEGQPDALSGDPQVQEAYLGEMEMLDHAAG
jgi:branched-chain amino acid transport system ATP-binding protein